MQFVAAGMQHKEDKEVSDMAAEMRSKFIPPEMARHGPRCSSRCRNARWTPLLLLTG